ncbi:hypothetical protein O181_064174, partial [Austropuccinia psidii MF-1]|nr:hypothetical protein [Austropuccinia psidii MF-1]
MGRPKLSESEPKSNLNGLAQPPKKRGRPAKSTESAPVKKSKSKPKQINSQTTELSKPADQVQPVKRPKLLPKKPIEKPLFSAKALRANFNPLPTTILDYSSFDSLSTNWRCGNRLNLFTFEKHAWIRTGQDITRYALIFGAGDMGQMGQGPDKLDDIRKPVLHPLIEELKLKGQMSQPQHLAGGGMHTLLVDDDGQIWSWGINDNAALGRKTEGIEGVEQEELESRPMLVSALNPQSNPDSGSHPFKAARVSAGDSVSVAISDQGELVAWGSFR